RRRAGRRRVHRRRRPRAWLRRPSENHFALTSAWPLPSLRANRSDPDYSNRLLDCFVAALPAMTTSAPVMIYESAFQKEGPRGAGLECSTQRYKKSRSGGLVVDLGEVVLGGLRTVGNELAEIFGGRLGPRDEHFAARAGEIGLDLHRLVEAL